jgi:monoamine oxidase
MDTEYDVVIVGSGVAGALCAWQLTELGNYKILILEAGDNGITLGQRIQFHHTMDTQGNRGDMYAPYKELKSREFAPAPENAQLELAQQKAGPRPITTTPRIARTPSRPATTGWSAVAPGHGAAIVRGSFRAISTYRGSTVSDAHGRSATKSSNPGTAKPSGNSGSRAITMSVIYGSSDRTSFLPARRLIRR